ncbi:MAG: hypothetical protein B7Z73_01745 [Planctomycetia bacterium 21-64-5]|nr:MAG: hypothetical protein B7Z73_01745 [Planctomycetia bacterium 21-64-5]HQU41688.1 protein kinase [Pirellulales bacterium]
MNSASSSQRIPLAAAAGDGVDRSGATLPGDLACDPDQATVITQRPPSNGSGVPRPTGPQELAKQLAGERLNHFQLLHYVGGGGMGAVFKALDTMLNREVALKVLSRDQGAEEDTRRRFQNEAQSAARLDHENIARVYYVGEDRGLNYIVFEFIEGVNLRELVEQKRTLPLPEALSYTLQIAYALAHASSREVVHRDIKPSNIIITGGSRAKLVDMGLARLHQVQPDGQDLTASGVTLGTFDYISPEQARDPRSADVRSDIYSLGCTLYYMLTGRPPFPDGTVLQKLLQHNSDAPPDPREFDPSLPPGVSALVGKMLAKDPLRRYQAPSDLVADLLLLADQIGCPLRGTERPDWAIPSETRAFSASLARHLPWIIPVSLLFAAVILAGHPLPGLDSPGDAGAVADLIRSRQRAAASPKAVDEDDKEDLDAPGSRSSSAGPSRDVDGTAPPVEPPMTADAVEERSNDPRTASAPPMPGATPVSDAKLSTVRPEPVPPSAVVADKSGATATQQTTVPSPAKIDEAAPAEPLPDGLLVVGDGLKGPRHYGSLAEACAAAKNNDVIELRYDGARREFPLLLHNQRIEIRAGAARRPVVLFRPGDTNPIATDRSMFGVSGGSLKLTGVAVELDLSDAAPSENWSLFTLDQADALRLEQCLLTVRNATPSGDAYHDKVAFITMGGGGGAEPMVMMPKAMLPLPPAQVVLNNCLVRGEADLLVDRDLKPVDFSCFNGLVAISERLFVAGEGASMPQEGVRVRVALDHVTALVRKGLCRIAASEAAPTMPEVEMRLDETVVISDAPEAALVEHVSDAGAIDLQSLFHWEAVSTVYIGFRTFWKIGPRGSASARELKTYEEWTEFWPNEKQRTRAGPFDRQIPASRRPLDTAMPADFAGEAESENDADDDRPAAGVDLNLLPHTP